MLKKKSFFQSERLHLIAGFSLVLSGIMAFFIYDVEMAISWGSSVQCTFLCLILARVT